MRDALALRRDRVQGAQGASGDGLVPSDGRVPPHDLDAEAAVLSAVLVDPSAIDKVLEILKPEHFYSDAHRRIYEAALDLHGRGQPVDNVQVGSWLKDRERIAQIGGMAYLTEILNAAPSVANVAAYAQTIVDKARVRQLIATCQRIAAQGYVDYGEAQEFIDSAEQEVFALSHTAARSTLERAVGPMKEYFGELKEALSRGSRITGTPTGFERLDRMTAGQHGGDLTIIAARPGMGKTSFVLNLCVNVANRPDSSGCRNGAAFFSLEMPKKQIAGRLACAEGRVDVSKLRSGHILPQDWNKLTQAAAAISEMPLWIDSPGAFTVLEMRAKLRRLISEYELYDKDGRPLRKLRVAAADYLQVMRGSDRVRARGNREQEIAEIARDLKNVALELNIAIIALAQINRGVESRGEKNKRPGLADLRESGEIEQAADNVVFIYRADYYDPESADRNIAELIIAKQRNGPTGTAKVRFDREYTRFDNLADGDYPEDDS